MSDTKKQTYYFFTEKSFKELQLVSDQEAIDAASASTECVRVMRQSDSVDIWKKTAQPAAN